MLAGRTNVVAFAIGAGTLALILLLKRRPRLPGILIAVVAATVVVGVFDLATRAGVSVLGPLPQGLPAPSLPLIRFDDLVPVLMGGIAVALVSFADTSVLSRTYAARHAHAGRSESGDGGPRAPPTWPPASSRAFPISSSSSRTPVAEAAGARTQLTGVVGALAIAVLLLLAPNLLQHLPNTALAAVVIASAIGLFEIADLRRIYRIQRWEFWLSMVCFAGCRGVRRHSRHRARDRDRRDRVPLGRLAPALGRARPRRQRQGLPRHHALSAGAADSRPRAVPLGRAALLRQRRALPRPRPGRGRELARRRCAGWWSRPSRSPASTSPPPTSSPSSTTSLHAAGIELCFAEMKDPVKDKLKRFGLFTRFGEQTFFATLGEAVSAYLEAHRIEWVDWKDRTP